MRLFVKMLVGPNKIRGIPVTQYSSCQSHDSVTYLIDYFFSGYYTIIFECKKCYNLTLYYFY